MNFALIMMTKIRKTKIFKTLKQKYYLKQVKIESKNELCSLITTDN